MVVRCHASQDEHACAHDCANAQEHQVRCAQALAQRLPRVIWQGMILLRLQSAPLYALLRSAGTRCTVHGLHYR